MKYNLLLLSFFATSLNCMSYEEKVLLNRFDSSVDKELELLSEEKLKQAKVTLLAMAEEDQNLRRNALVQGRLFTKQEAETISRSHVVKLKEIISEFGWPSHNNFGEKYAWAAFLIAQHADHDVSFQKEAKNYICSACLLSNEKNLDFIKQHYAFLYDRIAINEKKEQWFGTQVDSNGHLLPIRDVKGVDERRAKLGLMPLHAYQQMMINNLKKISNSNQ